MSLKIRNLPVECQSGPSVKRKPVPSCSNWYGMDVERTSCAGY
jgi:hypothetical protein